MNPLAPPEQPARAAILHSKDFWSGVMLVAIGAGAIWLARDYALGTSLRMGPGYFPRALGVLLVLFGLFFAGRALRGGALHRLRDDDAIAPGWSPRALIVLPLAFALFGLLIDRAGFIPALAALIVASAAAGPQFKLTEVALLTLVMTLLCVVVFIVGLGLPYRLFAWF